METVTSFRTPEEAALDLALPLLGTLTPPEYVEGPVAAAWPESEALRGDIARLAQRILSIPLADEGCLGILGDVAPGQRAVVAGGLAAALASERSAVLVDADLRHAHLSFDDRRRAQEGIVDVLRYGVRSPRVVAPTATPGLALLPVGSRTVDFPGTFGADAVPPLFAELRRGGEFLVVNGPDLADLEGAIPFLDQVPGWILVFVLGTSEAERMRSLRDRLGKDRCVGIVAIGEVSTEAVSAEAAAPSPAAVSDAGPASEEELPWEETPVAAAAPETSEVAAPLEEAVMEPQEEVADVADVYEPAPHAPSPTPIRLRRPRGFLIGIVVVLLVAIAGSLWFKPKQTSTRSSEELAASAPATSTPSTSTPGATEPESAPSLETPPTSAGTEATVQGSEPPAAGEASKATTPPGGEPATSSAPATQAPSPVSPPATTDQATSSPAEAARVPAATPPQTQDARPAKPPPAAPRAAGQTGAAPAALGETVWGVHVSSVKGRDGALQEAQRLAAGGRSTFVKQTEVPGKGTWWRVYVGPFGARAEAERMAATLRAAGEDAQVYRLARADVEAGMGREDR